MTGHVVYWLFLRGLLLSASSMATPGITTAIYTLVGVIVMATGGYLVAQRKTSGSPKTTPAEKLWDVAEEIRKDLQANIDRLEERLGKAQRERQEESADLRRQLREARGQNEELRKEVLELRRVVGATNADVGALRTEVRAVTTEPTKEQN